MLHNIILVRWEEYRRAIDRRIRIIQERLARNAIMRYGHFEPLNQNKKG